MESARRFIVRTAAGVAVLCSLGSTQAFAAGDPIVGKQRFKATCEVCHLAMRDANKNDLNTKIGPNLYGVIGRKAGTQKDFHFSPAMKASGVTWTKEVLRPYVMAPQKTIPNVRMTFKGVATPKEADDIIAYLATMK